MVSVSDVGDAFYRREPLSNGRNIESVVCEEEGKVFLVGYGWAIYAEIDIETAYVVYYSGWKGYSRTTSKHISQCRLEFSADDIRDTRPEFRGC